MRTEQDRQQEGRTGHQQKSRRTDSTSPAEKGYLSELENGKDLRQVLVSGWSAKFRYAPGGAVFAIKGGGKEGSSKIAA